MTPWAGSSRDTRLRWAGERDRDSGTIAPSSSDRLKLSVTALPSFGRIHGCRRQELPKKSPRRKTVGLLSDGAVGTF